MTNEEVLKISLETDEAGLLIGYHGQTLSALELILNLIIAQKLGEWQRISLEVGDYRQKKEEALKNLAQKIVARVKETGEAAALPYLTAAERRLIHLFLQDHPEVLTESQGEGENRRLVIKPRQTG